MENVVWCNMYKWIASRKKKSLHRDNKDIATCTSQRIQYLFRVCVALPARITALGLPARRSNRFSTRRSDDGTPSTWLAQTKRVRCLKDNIDILE